MKISLLKKLAALAALIAPHFALAAAQISVDIPGQSPISSSSPPGAFINNFYQFAIFVAGLLAFAIIVYGGVKYMVSAGNPSGQSDAKQWIWGALLGLLLLACAYLILDVINPQLVNLNLPQITSAGVTIPSVSGGYVSSSGSGGKVCTAPASGPCTVANLSKPGSCMASNAQTWAGICGHESSGNPAAESGSDYCLGPVKGQRYPVSIGLFQINITDSWKLTVDGKNCSQAFKGQAISCAPDGSRPCTTGANGTGQACQVVDTTLYNDCVKAAQQAQPNITVACTLAGSSGFGPWKADAACY